MARGIDFKQKEVININDGKVLGFVVDVQADFQNGEIHSIIVAKSGKIFTNIMSKNNIYYSYTENYFDGTNSSGIDAKISEEMNALYTKYDDKTWQYYVMDDMYNIISNLS